MGNTEWTDEQRVFVSTPFSLKYLLKLQIKLFFVSLQFK